MRRYSKGLDGLEAQSTEVAHEIIGAFVERYNREWLIERHDHRTRSRPVVSSLERPPD